MEDNIFMKSSDIFELDNFVDLSLEGREHLGAEMPVSIYRLFQYTLRNELIKDSGKEKTIQIFRRAGYEAGVFFANKLLNLSLDLNGFISDLQERLMQQKIGILRVEKFDEETGSIILTVAEDVDCSGLPVLGETVCNYDEGFISGILSVYTKKNYEAVEVDCWATGDRVCRFRAEIKG